MRKFIVAMAHDLSEEQKADVFKTFGEEIEIIQAPKIGVIDPHFTTRQVNEYVENNLISWLIENTAPNDIVLLQGEPCMVSCVLHSKKINDRVIVHATTERRAQEEVDEKTGKTIKKSVFSHIQFREYKY